MIASLMTASLMIASLIAGWILIVGESMELKTIDSIIIINIINIY